MLLILEIYTTPGIDNDTSSSCIFLIIRDHNNLLIAFFKVWFPMRNHLIVALRVTWPPPADVGRHNDAWTTNKTTSNFRRNMVVI